MGEITENQGFSVKDDGTIVRRRSARRRECPQCGKIPLTNGDYCRFCGHKFSEDSVINNYEKALDLPEMLFLIVGILVLGIYGLGMGTYLNSVVENDDYLYYRYNQKARKFGKIACVLSVISVIIWSIVFYELFC